MNRTDRMGACLSRALASTDPIERDRHIAEGNAIAEGEPVVGIWQGVSLEIDEITMGANIIARKVKDLRAAQLESKHVAAKVAADEIAKVAGQMNVLSKHLASVLAKHAERESRVRS